MKLWNLFLIEDWRKRVSDPADIAALQIIVSKINSVIKSNGSFKPFKMELNQLGYEKTDFLVNDIKFLGEDHEISED